MTQNRFQRPTTIILSSNRSRTHRYESRGVQRQHSLPSTQRHRSHRYSQSASPAANPPQSSLTHLRVHPSSTLVHRLRTNNTPPPPSDHNDTEPTLFNPSIISSLHQINIPNIPTTSRLPRPVRPSSTTQATTSNDNNDNDDVVFLHSRRSQHPRRLYHNIASQIHRSVQPQFSPPPSTHAPLLLDTGNLLAARGVNENDNEDNAEESGSGAGANFRSDFEFHSDLSVLNPSIFASRSSSPLSSHLIDHLSMAAHPSSTTQAQSVDDNNSTNNFADAAEALVKLKNSKSADSVMTSKDDNKDEDNDNHNKKDDDDSKMDDKSGSKSTSKMELDNDNGTDVSSPSKSSQLINTPQSQTKLNMSSLYIDWENESDSSEDETRYMTKKDKDIIKNDQRRLKISTKMSDDFKVPGGYMAHSIFVCPLGSDYAPDPQARLSCGHLVSYSAFVKLQTIKRSRQHEANRNRE